jgi:Tfp pilus assembly protein PilN
MRPVNLIPREDRRGESAPLRTGLLVYLVVGAFVAVLVGVTAMVLMGNKIADRKADVVRLEREDQLASAKARRLNPYIQFQSLAEQRVETVSSLADSRFDWERVMRELSLVLPDDIWLVNLTATAAPGVSLEAGGEGASGLRGAIPGPALQLSGCASGQEALAAFVTSVKDIDGVTRVAMPSSELAGEDAGAGVSSGGGADTDTDCRTRSFIAKFEMVLAFDAAPVPTGASEGEVAAPPTEESEAGSEESTEEG